ncbi:hypothetical protein AAKU67_003177 [Oxalobacteraceae bacterium GrIS 2.11]
MATSKNSNAVFNFSSMSGSSSAVSSKLAGMKNKQIVAFAFEHEDEAEAKELTEVFNEVAALLGNVKMLNEQIQNKKLQAIIEALVEQPPMPHYKMVEAKMTADARSAVLQTGEYLTAFQVAEMAGFSKTNPSAQPNRWKQDGLIFAVNQNGVDLFPGYALDPATKYRPYKSVAEAIKVFGNKKDAWGLAYWFASANSFLGGVRPQDVLAQDPQKLIAAAKDEFAELTGAVHG